jgi:Activator of Hsp90 ATPase homolog 1-like protein
MKKEALRVSTLVPTAPTTLYFAWLNAERHSAMTGGIAKIAPEVGGNFTAWDGYISGKLVILDLGRRLVMSWRTTDFPREAPDSRVEIHFEALGGSTRVTILHTDIPEGQSEKYREYWNEKYFTPMRTFFSKYLPDPRKPPPPRRPPPPPEEAEEVEEEEVTPKKAVKPPPPSKKVIPVAKPSAPAAKAPPAKAAATKAPPAKAAGAKAAPAKAAGAKGAPAKAVPSKPAGKKPAAKPAAKKAAAKPAAKKPAAKKPAAKTGKTKKK